MCKHQRLWAGAFQDRVKDYRLRGGIRQSRSHFGQQLPAGAMRTNPTIQYEARKHLSRFVFYVFVAEMLRLQTHCFFLPPNDVNNSIP